MGNPRPTHSATPAFFQASDPRSFLLRNKQFIKQAISELAFNVSKTTDFCYVLTVTTRTLYLCRHKYFRVFFQKKILAQLKKSLQNPITTKTQKLKKKQYALNKADVKLI